MKSIIALVCIFLPTVSFAQVPEELLKTYLMNQNNFKVERGGFKPTTRSSKKLNTQTFEVSKSERLNYKKEDFDGTPGWRLSEVIIGGDQSVRAGTTTFYKDRIRSVTRCYSNAVSSSGPSGEMACATATKSLCGGLKGFFQGSSGKMSEESAREVGLNPAIINQVEEAKKKLGGEEELGKMCTSYAAYMGAVNGLISKASNNIRSDSMLVYPYLPNPFSDVEDVDRDAIEKEMKALREWDDLEVSGAFLVEAEDRAKAMKIAANSLRVSSEILDICLKSNFEGPRSGRAGQGSGTSAVAK